jgi:hypothetical protein
MQKSFILFLGFAFLFTAIQFKANAQLTAETFAEAKAKGKATLICTYMSTEGFNKSQATGIPAGVCPDLMQAFADFVKEEEGIELTIRYQERTETNDFRKFLEEVKNAQGGVFGLGNITITDERKESFDFSPAFINNISVLISHKSVPDLSSMQNIGKEFAAMKAFVSKGTTSEKRLLEMKQNYFPQMNIEYIPATDFMNLISNEVSIFDNEKAFVYIDFIYFLDLIKKGVPVKRHAVGDDNSEKFGLIMPKGSDWSPLMARFMKEYTTSLEYKKSLTTHLSASAAKFLANF